MEKQSVTAQTLDIVDPTIWNVLKKKETEKWCTEQLTQN